MHLILDIPFESISEEKVRYKLILFDIKTYGLIYFKKEFETIKYWLYNGADGIRVILGDTKVFSRQQ